MSSFTTIVCCAIILGFSLQDHDDDAPLDDDVVFKAVPSASASSSAANSAQQWDTLEIDSDIPVAAASASAKK